MLELKLLDKNKTKRAAIILKIIFNSKCASLSEDERNRRSLTNIVYKYLEEKWTYSYKDKLNCVC